LAEAEFPAVLVIALIDRHRRHDIYALRGHQLRRRTVDQIAVLDGSDARLHAAPDGVRFIGMGHDVGIGRPRFLHRRAQFVHGEMRPVYGNARYHAAGRHDLDLVSALAQLLAGRLPDFVHAVDDAAERPCRPAAGTAEIHFLAGTKVALTASLRQGKAGYEHPGAGEMAEPDRLRQAPIGAARIADRREAAIEHALK